MTSWYISGVDSLVHHHAVARVGGRADAEMDRSTALRHQFVTGKYPDLLIFRGLKWYGGTKHHYQAVAALGFNYHH